MKLWRISNYADLSGIGGIKFAARWNSKGKPIIYATENPALAMLEILVHIDRLLLPDTYTLLEIQAGNHVKIEDIHDLKSNWYADENYTRSIGDKWLTVQTSAMLRVPSAVMPNSFNVLINPTHKDIERIKIIGIKKHALDFRLK